MALTCYTSWFSLLLFILFLSGIIIIFIYVCSLASNETHFYSFNLAYLIIALTVYGVFNNETSKLMVTRSLLISETDRSILIHKVYSFSVYMFIVLLITYLLVTLIVIVKISTVREGPVRTKK